MFLSLCWTYVVWSLCKPFANQNLCPVCVYPWQQTLVLAAHLDQTMASRKLCARRSSISMLKDRMRSWSRIAGSSSQLGVHWFHCVLIQPQWFSYSYTGGRWGRWFLLFIISAWPSDHEVSKLALETGDSSQALWRLLAHLNLARQWTHMDSQLLHCQAMSSCFYLLLSDSICFLWFPSWNAFG